MKKKDNILKKIANKAYEFGFVSKIKTDIIDISGLGAGGRGAASIHFLTVGMNTAGSR